MSSVERIRFQLSVSPWYWELCESFGKQFVLTAAPVLLVGVLGAALLIWLNDGAAVVIFWPMLALFAWQLWRAEGLRKKVYLWEGAWLDQDRAMRRAAEALQSSALNTCD